MMVKRIAESTGLTDEEQNPPAVISDPPTRAIEVVWGRLTAKKGIAFHEKEEVADWIGKLAKQYSDSHPGSAALVFVNSLEDHATVCKCLKGEQVQVLTGTLRGLERDRMADPRKETGCPIFARFLKPPKPSDDEKDRWKITPKPGTVYLVCTSAGEVGIDISADHMVCDLTAFDRMAQRFGRVNRFGAGDASIDIVYEATPDKKENDPSEQARWKTLELLKELPLIGERRLASPLALMQLRHREDLGPKFDLAYTPQPTILPVSDILFDAWALTTIRDKLPGRPPVEPYLHGRADWDPPETHVAWREEVERLSELFTPKQLQELLDDYPVKPHESLRDRSDRVFKHLVSLAERHTDKPVWLLEDDGTVEVLKLEELADKDKKDRINFKTILLPPSVGGLSNGMLNGEAEFREDRRSEYDVSGEWRDRNDQPLRARRWDQDDAQAGMRLIHEIDTKPELEDEPEEADTKGRRFWRWFVRPESADDDTSKMSRGAVLWDVYTDDVTMRAKEIVKNLPLLEDEGAAVIFAARFHDLGKKRSVWRRSIGNRDRTRWLAKSGGRMKPIELNGYRHELGSLLDVLDQRDFQELNAAQRELVLHLIAVHHGYGRPHFPSDLAFDPKPRGKDVDSITAEIPRRFARLQRKYGRWGLAYLEFLLRAADYAASAAPSSTSEDET